MTRKLQPSYVELSAGSRAGLHPFARAVVGAVSACGVALMIGFALSVASDSRAVETVAPHDVPLMAAPEYVAPAPAQSESGDVLLLAATIWAEARGKGEAGMRAAGHVIVNRIGERFGPDLATVIFSPWQFSAWNMGDPNRALAVNPERASSGADRLAWMAAQTIAREILEGRSIDLTGGALFYHTPEVSPKWARCGVRPRTLAGHVFYSDVRPASKCKGAGA